MSHCRTCNDNRIKHSNWRSCTGTPDTDDDVAYDCCGFFGCILIGNGGTWLLSYYTKLSILRAII
ncbi:hypothetical protein D3C84_1298510 [compost metagenome]